MEQGRQSIHARCQRCVSGSVSIPLFSLTSTSLFRGSHIHRQGYRQSSKVVRPPTSFSSYCSDYLQKQCVDRSAHTMMQSSHISKVSRKLLWTVELAINQLLWSMYVKPWKNTRLRSSSRTHNALAKLNTSVINISDSLQSFHGPCMNFQKSGFLATK